MLGEWRTETHLRHRPGRNSNPVQCRRYAVGGPATERARRHPASGGRANRASVAAAGAAVAALFVVPANLLTASPAHADPGTAGIPGMNEYLQCIQAAGVPARPSADDWAPVIKQIEWNLNNAEPPVEVAQRLAATGIKPNDAAAEVHCVMATVW
jgi:hypothetical protein